MKAWGVEPGDVGPGRERCIWMNPCRRSSRSSTPCRPRSALRRCRRRCRTPYSVVVVKSARCGRTFDSRRAQFIVRGAHRADDCLAARPRPVGRPGAMPARQPTGLSGVGRERNGVGRRRRSYRAHDGVPSAWQSRRRMPWCGKRRSQRAWRHLPPQRRMIGNRAGSVPSASTLPSTKRAGVDQVGSAAFGRIVGVRRAPVEIVA